MSLWLETSAVWITRGNLVIKNEVLIVIEHSVFPIMYLVRVIPIGTILSKIDQ